MSKFALINKSQVIDLLELPDDASVTNLTFTETAASNPRNKKFLISYLGNTLKEVEFDLSIPRNFSLHENIQNNKITLVNTASTFVDVGFYYVDGVFYDRIN